MGYSNKRRRSKRKRTKTLNAIQNNTNPPNDPFLSDESSLDILEQGSSDTNFCSSVSHEKCMACEDQTIPNSIFIDDVKNTSSQDVDWNVHDTLAEDSEHGQFSVMDIADEQLISDQEIQPDDILNDEDEDTVQSAESSFHDSDMNYLGLAYDPHHQFNEMNPDKTASYKIMMLLDTAGAPHICYNRLVALLKKLVKKEGFDIKKALNRETLMSRLERRYKTRPKIETLTIDKQEVFRFKFLDTLQDLIYSSSKHLHFISKTAQESNPEEGTAHELWNTPWMRKTFAMEQYLDFDPNNDIMLPIILICPNPIPTIIHYLDPYQCNCH